jgi:hypothetical protein
LLNRTCCSWHMVVAQCYRLCITSLFHVVDDSTGNGGDGRCDWVRLG